MIFSQRLFVEFMLMVFRVPIFFKFFAGVLTFVCAGCIGLQKNNDEFKTLNPKGKRTILLILVDGLGANTLTENLEQVPALKNYFAIENTSFPLAHSIFPSLTFPNLTSLLTGLPVHRHSVIGNKMILHEGPQRDFRLLDFESHEDLVWLNQVKEPALIYAKMARQQKQSASFSQSLYLGAHLRPPGNLNMAAAYLNKDYWPIDKKNIRLLLDLLDQQSSQSWPDFIFLHLVGIDGLSHDLGASHPEVRAYLRKLDQELEPIFQKLARAESQGALISSLLTADHGFVDVHKIFELEKYLKSKSKDTTVVNEGRNAALYFDSGEPLNNKVVLLKNLVKRSSVDLTALRVGSILTLFTKHAQWSFLYTKGKECPRFQFSVSYQNQNYCPNELESALGSFHLPPFALENLLSYFEAPQSPEAVVIASENYSFIPKYRGHHGGISQEEVLVPLLVHRTKIRELRIPALFEIGAAIAEE